MSRDRRFLELARMVAATSEVYPQMAALVVSGNRILSLATNVRKTHPIFQKYHHRNVRTIHAEAKALLRGDYAGATIYVAHNKEGRHGNSKPCLTCASLIIEAGLKKIVYYEDGDIKILKL